MLHNRDEIQSIIALYPLGDIRQYHALPSGFQSDNLLVETTEGRFVLKIIKDETPLSGEIYAFQEYLVQNAVKTPRPVRNLAQELVTMVKNQQMVVLSYIRGTFLTERRDIIHHIPLFASQLALIHRLSEEYCQRHPRPNPAFCKDCIQVVRDMRTYLPERPFLLQQYDEWYEKSTGLPTGRLQKAVIHGDCGPENFFFWKGELEGIIDFGAAGYDFLLYDIATMMMYLKIYGISERDNVSLFLGEYARNNPPLQHEFEHLHFFLQTRFLLQVLYFNSRLKANALQGVQSQAENEIGLADGIQMLRTLRRIPGNYYTDLF